MSNEELIEKCFDLVGHKGKYQKTIFLIMIGEFMASTFLMYSGTFIYIEPIFICNNAGKCNEKLACEEVHNDYS
jgi:hypothetical protein